MSLEITGVTFDPYTSTILIMSPYYRILVRIDGWDEGSQYPRGHFVCSLGPIGDVDTETKAILIEHGLMTQPFTKGQVSL